MDNLDINFWNGKKVFITGHTGFKGSWLSLFLTHLGANVKGFSLNPATNPSLFEMLNFDNSIESEINDIRDLESLKKSLVEFSPEIVFHMAAQPLVRYSYKNPIETYQTNVLGTANILEGSRMCSSLRAIVVITTDKCYENDGRKYGYNENDRMGGNDPYSSSKGCAELVTSSYRNSYFSQENIGLASARAGNVIGGGDWSPDRLIPDILKSFNNNQVVRIRNPKSTRPWQHVLEPLRGYLILAQKLTLDYEKYSSSFNFGPFEDDIKSVEWIVEKMSKYWDDSKWDIDVRQNPHEEVNLSLDIEKASKLLGWKPYWNIEQTIENIVEWHQCFDEKPDNIRDYSINEIESYLKDTRTYE